MRDAFPGYYKPTPDEMATLWAEALVVLDTNALFNLFRYTNATREAFLKVLRDKEERLWLPHQVGLEFQRGRLGIIDDQSQAFEDLLAKTKAALATVTRDVGSLRNHPTLDLDELRSAVADAMASIESKIEATRDTYQAEVLDAARHDATMDVITELYNARVGEPYDSDELEKLYADGERRYEAKQPPGFKDANKPAPARYGDLILWMQILDKAATENTAVIFVGDDQKEDWWREFKGRKVGPRVELVDEFRARVGKRIYFLTPYALMELASEHDSAITKATVQEVAKVSEAQSLTMSDVTERRRTSEKALERVLREASTSPSIALISDDLELRRRDAEIELRGYLAEAKELEARGSTGTGEHLEAMRRVSDLRGRVAMLSRAINDLDSQRRLQVDFALSLQRHLGEIGYPALFGRRDWSDFSLHRMEEFVARPEGVSAEFADIVRRHRNEYDHLRHLGWSTDYGIGGEDHR